ncbi:response regulator [Desulfogranum japonicum]|uniref:response regulator n=1 Tax=Desulfogranum japonicum TaxID=231447 RepID=UPI0004183076|nr:response regulator [Desulfogranum japonicum]
MVKKTLLLVDDEPFILDSLKREMEVEPFDVVLAHGGVQAVELLQNRTFNLVITDVYMHGVDGFKVLRAAKSTMPSPMVIVLSGDGNAQTVIKALRQGADDFLLKPCDVDELIFRANNVLQKQELQALVEKYSSMLPVCMKCRRIRCINSADNTEQWFTVEEYFAQMGQSGVTRSCCPECIEKF